MKQTYTLSYFPENAPDKLGFNRIKDILHDFCHSKLGKVEAGKLPFLSDQLSIQHEYQLLADYVDLRETSEFGVPGTSFDELTAELGVLTLQNGILEIDGAMRISSFLRMWSNFSKAVRMAEKEYKTLTALVNSYPYEKAILAEIEAIFNHAGEIRPGVSPELNRIRAEIDKTRQIQDRKFESMLRHCRQEGWLSGM